MTAAAIGNDVIDLGDPETAAGACHARFDARVFAPDELALLDESAAPLRLRWILWAAKEAAYKVARKRDSRTVFSPRRFAVRLHGEGHATVRHDERHYAVTLEVGARHVHAVARGTQPAVDAACGAPPPAAGRVVARVTALASGSADCPGDATRALAVATVAPLLGRTADALTIVRDGRIPRLCDARGPLLADLSLSHHGRFVAFACVLPATVGARGVAS